jgi:hypothetical protein
MDEPGDQSALSSCKFLPGRAHLAPTARLLALPIEVPAALLEGILAGQSLQIAAYRPALAW